MPDLVAIAGLRAEFSGLGLDLEPTQPLDPDVWPVILRPEEQGMDPLAVFVAKEAACKAQYAVSGVLFDFHALSVTLDGNRFSATFQQSAGRFALGDRLHGNLVRAARHSAAICTIRAF